MPQIVLEIKFRGKVTYFYLKSFEKLIGLWFVAVPDVIIAEPYCGLERGNISGLEDDQEKLHCNLVELRL